MPAIFNPTNLYAKNVKAASSGIGPKPNIIDLIWNDEVSQLVKHILMLSVLLTSCFSPTFLNS